MDITTPSLKKDKLFGQIQDKSTFHGDGIIGTERHEDFEGFGVSEEV